ncbi:OLC1v1014932C1 [Oldenlandia corymbosa var. corymbosa]|uniref:OLC1v1014932C1 n=1 Tax=Oldenlandia corymbosa var. corymbosa TaxID=529605 RepID=A0AAV1E5S5_OLDCO|nr:OLC1v1014932C1 [Oldenlandia corymbosa var. corymbosa]
MSDSTASQSPSGNPEIVDPLEPNSGGDDIFHSAVCVEDDHFKEGYSQGYADGLASAVDKEDGRLVGLKNGFEVGEELGFYRGVIDVWNSALRVDGSCFSTRVIACIKRMEDLLNKYPISNPEDESVTDLRDNLRWEFKKLCLSKNWNLEYQGYPKASEAGSLDF